MDAGLFVHLIIVSENILKQLFPSDLLVRDREWMVWNRAQFSAGISSHTWPTCAPTCIREYIESKIVKYLAFAHVIGP